MDEITQDDSFLAFQKRNEYEEPDTYMPGKSSHRDRAG